MLRELDLRQSRAGTQLLEPSPGPLAQFLGFRRLLGELDLSAHRPDPALPFRITKLSDHSSTIAPTREAAPSGRERRARRRQACAATSGLPRSERPMAHGLPLLRVLASL